VMSRHAFVHRAPDASLKARVAGLHLAATRKWSLTVERVTAMRTSTAATQRPWMTDTEAKARRVRTLMNDNPTSG
jgi:hypothetical protein